jgi:protein required for attachment to host cells
MQRACIIVVDAARARLFTFERTLDVDGPHEQFSEQQDLVNPARRLTPHELFSDPRPGSSRVGGRGFAFDDHRGHHIEHMDADFARAVAAQVDRIAREVGASRLIVCATPNMLGELRHAGLGSDGLSVDELPHELVKLTAPQLRARLAEYGVLPPLPPRPGRS